MNFHMKNYQQDKSNLWALILAGGDGSRLQPLTRLISGDDRPKQFCSMFGGPTLLDETTRRVSLVVPKSHTLILVTQTHERFYRRLSRSNFSGGLLVQPKNKGTAAAMILGLLRVSQLSPNATVAIFPSDHYISDDVRFMLHVESAFSEAQQQSEMIVLLGIEPTNPEVEYGWIEPDAPPSNQQSREFSRVRMFWEKPGARVARELMRQGCLWNSFVMVGRAKAFLELTSRALPQLHDSLSGIASKLGTSEEADALHNVYSSIQSANFSSEVLAVAPEHLLVSRVAEVDWCDLGEPSRALSAIKRHSLEIPSDERKERISYRRSISFLRQHYESLARAE